MPKDETTLPDLQKILANADRKDLQDFLWRQTRRNTGLEVKLRTHLVRYTESPPGVNKYIQILGLLLKHNVHGKISLTKRALQILREICQQMADLQVILLEEGELREAWDVSYALLSQIHLFMDRYHGRDDRLHVTLHHVYSYLEALIRQQPAPVLLDDIRKGLTDLAMRNPHVIYDLDHNVITCLYQSAQTTKDQEDVREILRYKISDPGVPFPLQHRYWCAMVMILPGSMTEPLQYLTELQLYEIAHLLNTSGMREALKRLVETFPESDRLPPPQALQWTRWKFEFAAGEKPLSVLRALAIELLSRDPRTTTYFRVREVLAYEDLCGALPSLDLDRPVHAEILAFESEWDLLERLIHDHLDLPLFMRFSQVLSEHSPSFETLARKLLLTYPHHHGGPECTQLISQVLHAIRNCGRKDLASTLAREIAAEFPGRFDKRVITTPQM